VGCTILRPTIIYAEGRDGNISRLAGLIRRFGVLPLMGTGAGLRQPVHAEDLAIGAIAAAASDAAIGKTYAMPGGETISYREMVGRIFDALGKPRRIISAPPFVWRLAFALAKPLFPNANAAMGARMAMDQVFDAAPAVRDFGLYLGDNAGRGEGDDALQGRGIDVRKRIRQQGDIHRAIQDLERRRLQGFGFGEIALQPHYLGTAVLRPGQRQRRFARPDQMLDDIASHDSGGTYNETLHPGQLTAPAGVGASSNNAIRTSYIGLSA